MNSGVTKRVGGDQVVGEASKPEDDELRDDADDFEDELIADMARRGAIEFW